MRSFALILLASLGGSVHAAEKIPLHIFLNDIREQLYTMAEADHQETRQAVISSIHVDLHVVVEKDAQGRPRYFVLDGVRANEGVITQRIAFDMELQRKDATRSDRSGSRFYSTRRHEYPPESGKYPPYPQYASPPGSYMPDIYPVILYDRHR